MNGFLQGVLRLAAWTPSKKEAPAWATASGDGASATSSSVSASESSAESLRIDEVADEMEEGARPPIDDASRKAIGLKMLSGKIGMDLSVGISVPVQYCEPTTNLTRMAEYFEYADILADAATKETSMERLGALAVFVVSGFSNTERYAKPLNPLLGETFEYVDPGRFRFIAEQTSHHPPMSASYTEGPGFTVAQHVAPTTKFLGNAVDIYTHAKITINFPATGDRFVYCPPPARLHNLILGRMWIEHFGDVEIRNTHTGEHGVLKFSKCGWMGKNQYEVHGLFYTAKNLCCVRVTGRWNERATAQWVSESVRQQYYDALDEPPRSLSSAESLLPTVSDAPLCCADPIAAPLTFCTWALEKRHFSGKYKMPEFVKTMLQCTSEREEAVCSTDAILRPDRRAINADDMEAGAIFKVRQTGFAHGRRTAIIIVHLIANTPAFSPISHLTSTTQGQLEVNQRADHTRLGTGKWLPAWFRRVPAEDPAAEAGDFVYAGGYWSARDACLKEHNVTAIRPPLSDELVHRRSAQKRLRAWRATSGSTTTTRHQMHPTRCCSEQPATVPL
eukprot:TRINITY_DN2178_c0_g1_i1.p1 TRINITY_DN2178_c0_g1~~TRINITY_DN2178_c0_g1_i1.p1  ORF type:complete len:562 (+),score=132.24 TRINITY_DN2178_c0_g1_i1:85-1770(+)